MKILITGAAGFLAQEFIYKLVSRGHEVIGIDNYSKYSGKKTQLPIEVIEGDARDTDLLSRHLKGRDCFIPMAAMVGGIDYFHQSPFEIMAYNDQLTQAAFKAALKSNITRFLLISSSMVFENSQNEELKEESLVNSPAPRSSYGFQKLNLEKYAEFAWKQYKLPCEIIRPFNGVGLGELQDLESSWEKVKKGEPTHLHVIPELILKALLMKNTLSLYGDGEQVRCFTSSKDIAIGLEKIINRPFDQLRYYHLSSDQPVRIYDLAKLILEIVRPNDNVDIKFGVSYEWDVKRRIPQTIDTQRTIGFKPSIGPREMIHEIFQYISDRGICH